VRTNVEREVSVFPAVIIIGLLGLAVSLFLVALRTAPRRRGARLYPVISALPLFMTLVLPAPFGLASHGPNDWARQTAVMVSRAGVALSAILLTIGVLLTLRAARAGDRRAVKSLLIETILAGTPALIVAGSAAMFHQW